MEIQLIAIAVLAAPYGCHAVRMICWGKKGIQTDQIGKGKASFIKLIEITMKIFAFLVLGVGIISIILDASNGPISVRIIGVVMSTVGTAVFTTAVLATRDSWRAGVSPTDKTEPVTNGIYQFNRNPVFLGSDLLCIGVSLVFFNWGLCVASVFVILMYHLQIVYVEGTFSLTTSGDEYLQYKKRVYCYIGVGSGHGL